MEINIKLLAAQPFLKGLSEQHLQLLVDNTMPAAFPAGKIIFREGQPANRFYLVLEGEITLESSAREKDSPAHLIQTIRAGEVLGWSWLFPPYYWHFDARAVTQVKAIFIYGTRVRELCEDNHDLGYELMKRTSEVVIERLQATRRQLLEQNGNPSLMV